MEEHPYRRQSQSLGSQHIPDTFHSNAGREKTSILFPSCVLISRLRPPGGARVRTNSLVDGNCNRSFYSGAFHKCQGLRQVSPLLYLPHCASFDRSSPFLSSSFSP